MSERDDRETKPETKPEGPKPAGGDVWLPPRLRERLESAAEAPPPSSSAAGWIVMVLLIAVAVGGVWWMVHNNQVKAKAAAAKAAAEAAAVADSIAKVKRADSLLVVARADSVAAFLKLPKWKQRQIQAALAKAAAAKAPAGGAAATAPAGGATAAKPTGGAAAPKPAGAPAAGGAAATGATPAGGAGGGAEAAPEAAPEKGPFVVDAGSYLFEDPAKAAAAALQGKTPLAIQVATVGTGGDATYHVYLGQFKTHGAAEKAASDLLSKGIVPQAEVVSAPKK